jgi:2-C-methyl-D-erythritol 4-phosphate cytidylyltransferase/2-C-methyl-D-erythritol 2,4-cyclodiphosphate synthase
LQERGFVIEHIDATIVAEEPAMKPHYEAIRKSLDRIFKIGLSNISFKAKSHERLGDIGHGNAMACYAVVTARVKK